MILKKGVFFRLDDVAEWNNKLKDVLEIFIRNSIPVHLSVIPKRMDKRCRLKLTGLIKEHPCLFDIGQHGFEHINHSGINRICHREEFGRARSLAQQRKDIAEGKKILVGAFGVSIDIFSPPWHRFNAATLRALEEEGFRALSAGVRLLDACPGESLTIIPVHLEFHKKMVRGWKINDYADLLKRTALYPGPNIGILLHHDAFAPEDFVKLERFIKALKRCGGICFKKLRDVKPITGSPAVGLRKADLVRYLTFQFVPKSAAAAGSSCSRYNFRIFDPPREYRSSGAEIEKLLVTGLRKSVASLLPAGNSPVGLLLSGGIDSAVILHTIREITDRPVITLTAAYDRSVVNLAMGQTLSKLFGTRHLSLIITAKDLLKLPECYDQDTPFPIGDNGLLPAYLMLKEIGKQTRTVFSGDGADCLFDGSHGRCPARMHGGYFQEILMTEDENRMVMSEPLSEKERFRPLTDITGKIRTRDPLKRQIFLDINFLVPNRSDYFLCAARKNRVSIAAPYLERPFVEWALGIPSKLLLSSAHGTKVVLRRTFHGSLPRKVIFAEKRGFSPPFQSWYALNLPFVLTNLIYCYLHLGISRQYVNYLIKRVRSADEYETGMKIWLLLNLAVWHRSRNV